MALIEPLFDALNLANVRYVVVGGLAVVLHGYPRVTADIDLAVDLTPEAARHAIATLVARGFHPSAPVDPFEFADQERRQSWIDEKGLMVFSMFDPHNPLLAVDLFAAEPIPFGELWGRAETIVLATTTVRVASIPDLIRLKRQAGRAQDHDDIEALQTILDTRARQGNADVDR